MELPPQARENITCDHFNAGHMVYIDNSSMDKLKRDLDRFYGETNSGGGR